MKFLCSVMLAIGIALISTTALVAQSSSPASSFGLYVYPRKNQNAMQQTRDENERFASTKQKTGVDPSAPAPRTPGAESQQAAQNQAEQAGKATPKGGTVMGSARGAAAGAAIGAISGNAGTGVAVGATVGAMAGLHRQKKTEKPAQQQAAPQSSQAQQQAQSDANAKHQADIDSFSRSSSACMDTRGHCVK